MTLHGPIRNLVALLLAAWLPLCCCSLNSLLNPCVACRGHNDAPGPGGAHDERDSHGSGPAHSHDGDSDHHPAPPGHDHQDGPCTCDNHKQGTITIEKQTVDLPTPVLAYVLPAWEAYGVLGGLSRVAVRDAEACVKPASSLLRMHCALIV